MASSLQTVFSNIAATRNERELQQAVLDTVGEHFGVQRWGIYLLDEQSPTEGAIVTTPDVCVESNPIGRYVMERHAPVHEQLILPPEGWQNLCPRSDHAHVMSGPIICNGSLVGTLNLARESGHPAFNANDLADLSALCLHISAKLASLRSQPQKFNSSLASRLTPRELEIAELVAQGLTNAAIGAELWITEHSVKQALKRMFRKLEVSSRGEMVAKLQNILVG